MLSDDLFSLGLFGPLLYLILGFVAIGLFFSGAVIVARCRSGYGLHVEQSQRKIDWGTAILAVSALLPMLAGILYHYAAYRVGTMLAAIGLLLLWPVSVALAIFGRGTGRRALLAAHGLIAFWMAVILLIIWIHGDWSQLMSL